MPDTTEMPRGTEVEVYEDQVKKRPDPYQNLDVDILRDGSKIILPAKPSEMPYSTAIKILGEKAAEEDQTVEVNETINYAVFDGAVALYRALCERFGWVKSRGKTVQSFFGPVEMKPDIISVPVDYNEYVDVFWGTFELPGMNGSYLTCGAHKEGGKVVFKVEGEVKRKHLPEVKQIVELARKYCRDQSIYKGKAMQLKVNSRGGIDMNAHPTFLDVNRVREEELVFSESLQDIIETNLFTPVRYTDDCLTHGVPLKRGVLLEGAYGVGKTLTAAVASKICKENGWTFISIDSVRGLKPALEFASMYQPCMIFAEDIDRALSGERDDKIDAVLNTIDGVGSKHDKVITVLTTNEVTKVNQAMLRPGRLDAVISITPPDAKAAEKLMRIYGRGLIPDGEDLTMAGEAIQGQIPAVIREVVERSKLYSIGRGTGEVSVSCKDLVRASQEMHQHLELLNRKDEEPAHPAEAFMSEIAKRCQDVDFEALSERISEKVREMLDE